MPVLLDPSRQRLRWYGETEPTPAYKPRAQPRPAGGLYDEQEPVGPTQRARLAGFLSSTAGKQWAAQNWRQGLVEQPRPGAGTMEYQTAAGRLAGMLGRPAPRPTDELGPAPSIDYSGLSPTQKGSMRMAEVITEHNIQNRLRLLRAVSAIRQKETGAEYKERRGLEAMQQVGAFERTGMQQAGAMGRTEFTQEAMTTRQREAQTEARDLETSRRTHAWKMEEYRQRRIGARAALTSGEQRLTTLDTAIGRAHSEQRQIKRELAIEWQKEPEKPGLLKRALFGAKEEGGPVPETVAAFEAQSIEIEERIKRLMGERMKVYAEYHRVAELPAAPAPRDETKRVVGEVYAGKGGTHVQYLGPGEWKRVK